MHPLISNRTRRGGYALAGMAADHGGIVRIDQFDVSDRDLRTMQDVVDQWDEEPRGEGEAYRQLPDLVAGLPAPIVRQLVHFRENRYGDALVFHSLPLGRASQTPTPGDPIGARRIVYGFQALCMSMLGAIATPFAYRTQQQGRLINNICPSPDEAATSNLGIGSKLSFDFHTEDAFMKDPPSFLQLGCIRNPTNTGTSLAAIPDDFPSHIEGLLRQPVFHVGTNRAQQSWDATSAGPILYGSDDRPFMRFNAANTRVGQDGNAEHVAAIDFLSTTLTENARVVPNGAGDLVIVNNYFVAHGRSGFVAKFDGGDRWLQRIVGYRDPRTVAVFTSNAEYPTLEPT